MEEFRKFSSFDDVKLEKTNVDIEYKTENIKEFPNVTVKTEPEVGWSESLAHNDTVTNMEKDDNSQSADIKHESEFQDNDGLPNNTEEGVRRWTVQSSTLIPVVKTEESSELDHGHVGFEPTSLFSSKDSRTWSIQNNGKRANKDGTAVKVFQYKVSPLPIEVKACGPIKATPVTQQDDKVTAEKIPYKCDICKKEFNLLGNLRTHQRIHSGEKPYNGDVRNKVLALSGTLKIHQHIHTAEKPHKCDVCNKEFKQLSTLTIHQRSHTGEKPYTCDVCIKQFTQLNNLRTHKRIHTGEKPFSCDVCNKKFTQLGDLTRHKRIHTGEKSYQCDFCNEEFDQLSNLRKHRYTHIGEKPYKCDFCEKEFVCYVTFRDHQHSHTGEKA